MDVQLRLNLPVSGSENLANVSSADSGRLSNRDGFSNHLTNKINNVNKQQNSAKNLGDDDSMSSVKQEVTGNSSVSSTDDNVSNDTNILPVFNEEATSAFTADLAFQPEGNILQSDVDLSLLNLTSTADGELADQAIGVLPPGNSLPDIALLDAELPLTEGVPIVFDPLSDVVGDSLSAPILLVGVQARQSWKLDGNNVAADVANKSVESFNVANVDMVKSDAKLFQWLNVGIDIAAPKQAPVVDNLTNTLSIAGQASQQQASPLATDNKLSLSVETPVSSPRWGNDFNQRIQWMVGQSVSGAQIRLSPQQLGPIEVRVQIHNDQATISFTAQHGATREAIDAALPRLRDMLSEQQVDLVDVNVSQHSFAEQQEQQLADNSGDENTSDVGLSDVSDNKSSSDSLDSPSILYTGLFNKYA